MPSPVGGFYKASPYPTVAQIEIFGCSPSPRQPIIQTTTQVALLIPSLVAAPPLPLNHTHFACQVITAQSR